MKQFILIIFILVSQVIFSQDITQPFNGKSLQTDQFGYYYEIFDNEIKKYSKEGKLNCTYSNNVYGVIASVDVTNPYKVLVYFREFTKILILDNTLSPTSELIDLTTLELDETTLVSRSYNNSVWYYNPVRFELIRKTNNLKTTNSSGNLSTLLNINIQPNFMIEYNNKVYLNEPKKGILVFDIYGTYLKTIPLYNLKQFQIKDKFLIYINDSNQVEWYDFFTLEKSIYQPNKYDKAKLVRIENSNIYIVDKNNRLIIDKIEN